MLQTFVPLDYETQRFFQFEVVASDGGGLEDTALLSISVMDENDNPPGFTQSPYNVSVSENTTSDSLLTRVQAVDRDSGIDNGISTTVENMKLLLQMHLQVSKGTHC